MLLSSSPEALSLADPQPRGNEVSSVEQVFGSITSTLIMPVYICLKQSSKGALLYVPT
jgi:hypothetical protein